MKKKTSTTSSRDEVFAPRLPIDPAGEHHPKAMRSHVRDERSLMAVRMLCVEWSHYWLRGGSDVARTSAWKKLKALEEFLCDRYEWMRDAVTLQRRARESSTKQGRNLAIKHVDALNAMCDEVEVLLRSQPAKAGAPRP